MLEAVRFDVHLADQSPLAAGGHGRQVALAVGALDARQPGRVGREGPVDHEQPYQMAGPISLHDQAVAGKDIVCAGMVQAEEFASGEALALRLAFPHIGAVYTRGARGKSAAGGQR